MQKEAILQLVFDFVAKFKQYAAYKFSSSLAY